jgi:hypothetical protein
LNYPGEGKIDFRGKLAIDDPQFNEFKSRHGL